MGTINKRLSCKYKEAGQNVVTHVLAGFYLPSPLGRIPIVPVAPCLLWNLLPLYPSERTNCMSCRISQKVVGVT